MPVSNTNLVIEGGSAPAQRIKPVFSQTRQNEVRDQMTADANAAFTEANTIRQSDGSKAAVGAARSQSLANVDIGRREAAFDLRTGKRDIKQQREAGLKAAINNALQRGIFRSGIRKENQNLVNREADEAGSDLQSRIGFALERLKSQEKFATSGGFNPIGGLTGLDPGMIEAINNQRTQDDLKNPAPFTPPTLTRGGGPQ